MMRAECLVRTSIPDHPWPVVIRPETMEADRNNDSGISPGRTSSEANSDSPNFNPNSPHSPRATTPSESPSRNRSELKIETNHHFQKTNEFYNNYYYGNNRPYSPPNYGYSRNGRREETPKKLVIDENNFSPNSESNNSKNDKMDNLSEKSNDYDCDGDYEANELPAEDSLERLKTALEKSSVLSGIFRSRMEEDGQNDTENSQDSSKKEFPCPLCAYTTPYRHRYMEHLGTHYSDKCTLCDFTGQNVQDLRIHLQEVHNITDIHDLSDPQDNNSDYQDDDETPNGKRGKSKSFKCKQCNYVTTTKLDFWEHSKGHIKAEKLLTCPKCPFVTEYKHHLEYHLRNHFGSKPFKCTQCSYSCVNKSMLNSHLKSHSNVYQYRCADCAYATKYCHSLKLHLRKYQHKPAMVLNADGSPNPLPIIDVYGTRRGPKQKPKTLDEPAVVDDKIPDIKIPGKDKTGPNLPGGVIVPNAPQSSPKSPNSVYSQNNNDESHNGSSPKFFYCNMCEYRTVSPECLNQHMILHAAESSFAHHFFKSNNNLLDAGMMKDYFQSGWPLDQTSSSSPYVDARSESPLSLVSPKIHSPVLKQPVSPLDLSKQDESESEAPTATAASSAPPEKKIKLDEEHRPNSTTKHRRKGKACKFQRIINDYSSPEEDPYLKKDQDDSYKIKIPEFKIKKEEEPKECEETKPEVEAPTTTAAVTTTTAAAADETKKEESHNCVYCDIVFKDVILYTMHMGYHGYQDPFTCNSCGCITPDKVSFFLHIARSSHT